jgi:hypothetical protein
MILFWIVTLFLTLATAQFRSPRVSFPIENRKSNQWRIESLSFKRWSGSSSLMVRPNFFLYRSYFEPCPIRDIVSTGMQMPCGWVIPDSPIECGVDTVEPSTIETGASVGKWYSCMRYPRAVEGERELSENTKTMLKWRTMAYNEGKVNSRPLPSEIPFKSIEIEIVNGVLSQS